MTQNEIKARYEEHVKLAWDDPKMVAHCIKTTGAVVEHCGKLYAIDKPRINTRFCFGHGYYGVSTTEEENAARENAQRARDDFEWFINENMHDINRRIDQLRSISEDMRLNWAEGSHPMHMIAVGPAYWRQPEACDLSSYEIVNTFRDCITPSRTLCTDPELIEKLIAGFEQVKAEFAKRLNTYLKRYGLSKVQSWTYLVD